MTDATVSPDDVTSFDIGPLSRRPTLPVRTLAIATILAASLPIAAWVLSARPSFAPAHAPMIAAAPAARPATPAAPTARTATEAAATGLVALLDPASILGAAPAVLGQSLPLGPNFAPPPSARPAARPEPEVVLPQATTPQTSPLVEGIPLPEPRPSQPGWQASRAPLRMPARRLALSGGPATTPAPAPPDNRSFLEKFFGMLRPSGPVLAYATPEDGLFGPRRTIVAEPSLPHDAQTAVYDIAAHTVYMPNGARLEAHSGFGARLDDPRHVGDHNVGATPPHVYDLELRAQLFHGVQALRLNPVGNGGVFGRTGLLAHTYMLGPKGDSNGCVSIKDYNIFLQSYLNGDIKRLAVVPRLI